MKRYSSSWLQFSSLLPSALPREHRRKCKDCKHTGCLATEDRLSPRWSPTASSSCYTVRGGEEYHLLPLSRESLCLRPAGSRRPVFEPTPRYLATATLFITSSCFAERSLCRGGDVYQLDGKSCKGPLLSLSFRVLLSGGLSFSWWLSGLFRGVAQHPNPHEGMGESQDGSCFLPVEPEGSRYVLSLFWAV